jgi:hypothetical protein
VVTDDFTALVPRALPVTDARVTLQVAGGIALAADKLPGGNPEDPRFLRTPTI